MDNKIRGRLRDTLDRTLHEVQPLMNALGAEVATCPQGSEDEIVLACQQLRALSKVLDDLGVAKALLDKSITE